VHVLFPIPVVHHWMVTCGSGDHVLLMQQHISHGSHRIRSNPVEVEETGSGSQTDRLREKKKSASASSQMLFLFCRSVYRFAICFRHSASSSSLVPLSECHCCWCKKRRSFSLAGNPAQSQDNGMRLRRRRRIVRGYAVDFGRAWERMQRMADVHSRWAKTPASFSLLSHTDTCRHRGSSNTTCVTQAAGWQLASLRNCGSCF
jgi:hypothetical protein